MRKAIVVLGNPADGYAYYGPFASTAVANEWAEENRKRLYTEEYWIDALLEP